MLCILFLDDFASASVKLPRKIFDCMLVNCSWPVCDKISSNTHYYWLCVSFIFDINSMLCILFLDDFVSASVKLPNKAPDYVLVNCLWPACDKISSNTHYYWLFVSFIFDINSMLCILFLDDFVSASVKLGSKSKDYVLVNC